MVRNELRWWALSLLLASPVALIYLCHLQDGPGDRTATGFIQYDMPYYMANAREHFDSGHFCLFYGNPFSPRYGTPAIYFQPLILALGLLWRATGADPGMIFMAFGAVAAVACVRVAIALYREVVGLESPAQGLGLIAFLWGGGLLGLSGLVYTLVTEHRLGGIYTFDPGEGWWFLNFGRNLIYPTEAAYHALFLGCMLLVLRGRYTAAAVVALVVSLSHPFTGLQLLAILAAWAAFEVHFLEDRAVPRRFLRAILGLLGLHLGYYLVFLKSFPEHRALMTQWELPWTIEARSFLPADLLVGGLAFWAFRRFRLARGFFASARNRLFLAWFLVSFALANHEFAFKPVQPLHFTRGYEWMALFLMGSGTLIVLLSRLLAPVRKPLGPLGAGLVLALFLSDNVLFFGSFMPPFFAADSGLGMKLSRDQRELLSWLNAHEHRGFLLLSQDPEIGYLATVYTPLRSWYSHWANTPMIRRRISELDRFFASGQLLPYWKRKPLLVVSLAGQGQPSWAASGRAMEVFRNRTYNVFRLIPERAMAGRDQVVR
ncbi:MAG: hypothetical protein IRY99_14055 [Isosphaeraceae bacterium]|nr:hypothetical protein [Isosphaeraceae bacterium]